MVASPSHCSWVVLRRLNSAMRVRQKSYCQTLDLATGLSCRRLGQDTVPGSIFLSSRLDVQPRLSAPTYLDVVELVRSSHPRVRIVIIGYASPSIDAFANFYPSQAHCGHFQSARSELRSRLDSRSTGLITFTVFERTEALGARARYTVFGLVWTLLRMPAAISSLAEPTMLVNRLQSRIVPHNFV
jgi:hypothetical protein